MERDGKRKLRMGLRRIQRNQHACMMHYTKGPFIVALRSLAVLIYQLLSAATQCKSPHFNLKMYLTVLRHRNAVTLQSLCSKCSAATLVWTDLKIRGSQTSDPQAKSGPPLNSRHLFFICLWPLCNGSL